MASFKDDPDYLGPISATPQKMVEEMLAVAGVTAADVVYDLGCNDGRVLVTAATASISSTIFWGVALMGPR